MDTTSQRHSWALAAAVVAALASGVAAVAAWTAVGRVDDDRTQSEGALALAVTILRTEPSRLSGTMGPHEMSVRRWATRLLERQCGLALSDEERLAMILSRLP